MWQPDRTNWCHGSPAGHAWSLLEAGQPPSSPDGRGRPNRQSSPLMATFLMLSRSRGAIGRVRATPGALSMAGRTTDGPDGRTDGIPGQGKGLSPRCVRRSPKRAGLVMRFGTHSKQIEISPYKAYKREVSLVTSARELPQGVTFGRNCLYALRHTVRFGFDGSVRSRYVLVSTSRVLHAQPCRSSHIVAYMTSICNPS